MAGLPRHSFHRPTRPLTYELANHAKAYLEGKQYNGGFAFLNALLTSGTSISTPDQSYASFLPPAPYLALASTLIVYPHTTTKAKSADVVKGADAALRYLRSVHNTVDPTNEILRSAFSFPDDPSRRRAAGQRVFGYSPPPDGRDETERLTGVVTKSQSLWLRAKDFWHIVGWAFNCSVAYKKRWNRWKLWLDVMMDFLEADWEERVELSQREGADAEKIFTDSILWHFVKTIEPSARANRRAMVGAILAMGDPHSRKLYPEIWKNETVEFKHEEEGDKVGKIDIENGDFGDYENLDEDEIMGDAPVLTSGRQSKSPASPSLNGKDDLVTHNLEHAVDRLGGMDAIVLRQRLLAMLARVAQAIPAYFTRLGDLFDHITEAFLEKPTIIMGLLLSTSQMPADAQLGLKSNLLLPLVSGELPDYTRMEPLPFHLEIYFLPARGTTHSYAANAKISLVVEQMFMHFANAKLLDVTDHLRNSLEAGIEARKQAYGRARAKKRDVREEEQAKVILHESTERLLGMLEVLEIAAGQQPRPRAVDERFPSFSSAISSAISLSSPEGSSVDEEDILDL
ncbi:hypothetical protein BCR34DRAFT_479173 [Clohesyomyces aquaticus]|uniref:Uncharacterized protein n=1 Tax=Clohesyomyces aquaticus TaxID=1231657 RepID=A0A1Y1ZXZ1_9PLEO|nr:hypothetical protein BCR34DRAFT_479173 [Clohesyomyces aquaticus]